MDEDLDNLSSEEIFKRLDNFEKNGFKFFPAWTMDLPFSPDRIKLPSGKIVVAKLAENEASNFYDLVRSLDANLRYERYQSSFEDSADMKRVAKENYSGIYCLI